MAQFFISGKIYDTEQAEKIVKFKRSFPSIIEGIKYWKEMTLYRTARGNWFSVSEENFEGLKGYAETEESAKRILMDINDVENFERLFGKAERA